MPVAGTDERPYARLVAEALSQELFPVEVGFNNARFEFPVPSSSVVPAVGILQNATNEAAIRTKADADTAALRQGIAGEQQTALNQLYATEDPSIAENVATTSVNASQLQTPNLNPLGELFKPLVIGSLGGLSNVVGTYNFNKQLSSNNPSKTTGYETNG